MLSRLRLEERRTQARLMVTGVAAMGAAHGGAAALTAWLGTGDPDGLAIFITVEVLPPMPLYMVAAMGAAAFVIGLCLRIAAWLDRRGLLAVFTRPGRQTLTLYFAHIVIGMGALDALGLLHGQSLVVAVAAALIFTALAILYAAIWARYFSRGPLEMLMRRLAG